LVPRSLAFTLLLASAGPVLAQPAAECPTAECTPVVGATNPVHTQLWRDAAGTHQIKIAFVDALQRFVRAQAGTFGDEGADLRDSLRAMRDALTQWDRAIAAFQAQAASIRDAESSMALATVLLDRHRIDDALRALAAAEQSDDSRPDLYAMRALAYDVSNRPDETVRALRRATALDARDPTTSYLLVQRLTQLNRPDDAESARRVLQRSLAAPRRAAFARIGLLSQRPGTSPIFPQARYASGFAVLDSGDYGTALARFTDAIARDPLLTGSLDDRSRIADAAAALRSGRIDAALQLLQSAAATFARLLRDPSSARRDVLD
jgi:tetratricopeptide (TPR) repeat protein